MFFTSPGGIPNGVWGKSCRFLIPQTILATWNLKLSHTKYVYIVYNSSTFGCNWTQLKWLKMTLKPKNNPILLLFCIIPNKIV